MHCLLNRVIAKIQMIRTNVGTMMIAVEVACPLFTLVVPVIRTTLGRSNLAYNSVHLVSVPYFESFFIFCLAYYYWCLFRVVSAFLVV